jgi:hypothetical protein
MRARTAAAEAHAGGNLGHPRNWPAFGVQSTGGSAIKGYAVNDPQQCLNFRPEPHGHGSLRPI